MHGKFEKTALKAVKNNNINASIIDIVNAKNFTTVLARIVNATAEELLLDENGKISGLKTVMLLFDSFRNSYLSLGEKVGEAWVDGESIFY